MSLREVVGGELGRNAAPAARHAGGEHCRHRGRAPEQAQHVGEEAGEREPDKHERDRQVLRAVAGVAWRRRQARADHADHDRRHRQVLAASGVLVQHALREEHQHQQPRGERRLHDDQRREQQRDDLQWPAEYRQARAEQPARAAHQAPGERQAQVLIVGRLLGVHCLQGDP
jgi:hypothetical protein